MPARWASAGVADDCLDVVGDPAVVAAGQAVGQDGALQGDDAPPVLERAGDLGLDDRLR
jgi:hypothetical protein